MIDPIIVQKRLAHVGDIRTGTKTEKGYPTKLETFRITTQNFDIALELAGQYGGTPQSWEDGFELITDHATLPVIVPPQTYDPYLEVWSKGGLQRRCTGTTEYTTTWPPTKIGPCDGMNPDNQRDCTYECKPATRLSVLLPDTSIVGTFTVRSTGWNAYSEISSAMALLRGPHADGVYCTATLELRQEERRAEGKVTKFGVVTLRPHITSTIAELMDTPQALHPSGRPVLPQDQPPIPQPTLEPSNPQPVLDPQGLVVVDDGPQPPPIPPPAISALGDSPLPAGGTDDTIPGEGPPAPVAGAISDPSPSSDTGQQASMEQLAAHDELTEWLTNPPRDDDVMKILETKLRTAYDLAHSSGVIPDDGDPTPLVNRAVTKYARDHPNASPKGADAFHVGDLRKSALLELTHNTYTYLTRQIQENENP